MIKMLIIYQYYYCYFIIIFFVITTIAILIAISILFIPLLLLYINMYCICIYPIHILLGHLTQLLKMAHLYLIYPLKIDFPQLCQFSREYPIIIFAVITTITILLTIRIFFIPVLWSYNVIYIICISYTYPILYYIQPPFDHGQAVGEAACIRLLVWTPGNLMEVAGWARYGQMARAQREMGRLEIEWHIYI